MGAAVAGLGAAGWLGVEGCRSCSGGQLSAEGSGLLRLRRAAPGTTAGMGGGDRGVLQHCPAAGLGSWKRH